MTSASVRACQPCRTAKTKCDLSRPVCSRCARLKHSCTGYTADVDFAFRNENFVAQRNSERARKKLSTASVTLAVLPERMAKSTSPPFVDFSGQLAKTEHPWLQDQAYKTIPKKVSRLVLDRLIDRFFYDWVTVPADKGVAVGHLAQVPALYNSTPEGSTFRTIIDACAYAHMQYEQSDGVSFNHRARSTYGKALMLMKEDVSRKQSAHDIRLMASLLLFDNFESLYLGRTEILGPHTEGVKHILSEMPEAQFDSELGYILWKIAYTRLLARQLISRQSPTPAQLRWTKYVSGSRPDLYLLMSSVKLAILVGQINDLVHDESDMKIHDKLERAQSLLTETVKVKACSDAWLMKMPLGWLPRQIDGHISKLPASWTPPSRYGPLPMHYSLFQDMQMAFALNFYQTTNVIVHESKIELYRLMKSLSMDSDGQSLDDMIALDIQAIVALSGAVMATFPGFVQQAKQADGKTPAKSKNRADNSGRFFAMYTMPVFLRAEHVPEEHKFVARWLVKSVQVDYALAEQ